MDHSQVMSLFELNNMVHSIIEDNLTEDYWVRAELSEVRVSQKGHCFIELVDKSEYDDTVVARARGVIMRNVFPLLKHGFEQTTGQSFTAGLKVLLLVNLSFSEVYGYSLIVQDIDFAYTMGSMAQRRKEILDQLRREGVADMNKELELPDLMQRIAVISSPTAAGYEDFCNQLDHNNWNLKFHYKLFPAIMQGEETEQSVISALESIAEEMDDWDLVVIIRGGGAVSDLTAFDTFLLANECAQFPLPVFTGIGHERDVCLLDFVANRQFKTPTAVASFLIEQMHEQAVVLEQLEEALYSSIGDALLGEKERLRQLVHRMDLIARGYVPNHLNRLDYLFRQMSSAALHGIHMQQMRVDNTEEKLLTLPSQIVQNQLQRIQGFESIMKAYDPQNILRMGYSITLKDGKAVRDASQLKKGDEIITHLHNGEVKSRVE